MSQPTTEEKSKEQSEEVESHSETESKNSEFPVMADPRDRASTSTA